MSKINGDSSGAVTTPRILKAQRGQGRKKVDDVAASSVGGQPWFSVDKEGLRRTIARKSKVFAAYELVQNAWDEDATEVNVTLTRPKNDRVTLTCVDNSPKGYRDLSNAHTLFAGSYKKADPAKRGRFNVGEKFVLALCDEATITSTTGRVNFHRDGTRSHSSTKTKEGTEFHGELHLTLIEWEEICQQVKMLLPPIPTFFNGVPIPIRPILHEFQVTLPTEISDENGICRIRQRQTAVRLYDPQPNEKPFLYENGLPVVEVEGKWHIDVGQKLPLNLERDNVTPSYLRALRVAVVNEVAVVKKLKDVLTDEDAAATWVADALTSKDITPAAVKTVVDKRFGENPVLYDGADIGSNRECTAKNITVVPRGTFTQAQRINVAKVIKRAGEVCPTDFNLNSATIPDNKLTDAQLKYKRFILDVAPLLLNRAVTVDFIDDEDAEIYGCTRWLKDRYIFTVNIAHHDVEDWHRNYDLVIHELAHHSVQRNDHLFEGFYRATSGVGAKLAQVALTHPHLFAPKREPLALVGKAGNDSAQDVRDRQLEDSSGVAA